jgi:hypothetical protein
MSAEVVKTSFSHRGFAVIGAAFVLFEILFVTLLAGSFWFPVTLVPFSIPAIVLAVGIAILLLQGLETPLACRALSFVWHGKPPLVFLRWVEMDKNAFTFGIRRIQWEVVDEASLTLFGNLVLKSRKLCGDPIMVGSKDTNPADIILKLPFAVIGVNEQKMFVERLRLEKPTLRENERLKKQIAQPKLKNFAIVQNIGVVFLSLVLLDVGYSTFSYLDTLKEYYLSRQDALQNKKDSALKHLEAAENLRTHPLPISWVTRKLTSIGGASDLYQHARTDALWAVGKKQEAIDLATDVAKNTPKNFRPYLRVARLYEQFGKPDEAKAQVQKAIEERDDALLPRLYLLSLLLKNDKPGAQKAFDEYSKKLDADVFGEEPVWPPGGDRFVTDVWYKDDLHFVLDPLIRH